MRTVFLDHQSSTPVMPEVLEAMQPFFAQDYGNPSSLYQAGMRARHAVEKARAQFAELINAASPEEIFFTSGGTEAANWAVKGVAWSNPHRGGKHIILSAAEHPAVRNSVEFLEKQGFTATRVPVDALGFIDPAAIGAAIQDDTILVCVHDVNHDVGTIQRIREIADLASERGVPLFVDALASAGWRKIDVQATGVSLLSLTAHRFYGPKGVGVLYRNRRARLANLIHGGDQEQGRRAGTHNVPAIVGGGVAACLALRDLAHRSTHTARLQQRLWQGLKGRVPLLALHGPEPGPSRMPNNLNVSSEFTEGEGQMLSLDMAGIAVASGTSCVSRAVKVSPVLEAMGVSRALAQASVIFSLGKDNADEEIDHTIEVYSKVIDRLRSLSPSWEEYQSGHLTSAIPREDPARARANAGSLGR